MRLTKILVSVPTVLITLVAATTIPVMAENLRCGPGWDFDGNGFGGTLSVAVDGSGNLTGTVYGDPIQGYYNNVSNEIMFIRSAGGVTDPSFQQVFTGYYWQEAALDVLAGSFEGFNASGGTAGRHRWGWKASCQIIPSPEARGTTPKGRHTFERPSNPGTHQVERYATTLSGARSEAAQRFVLQLCGFARRLLLGDLNRVGLGDVLPFI